MKESDIKLGYVYHINDVYFDNVKDNKLMQNHDKGSFRPTYFCLKDENTELFWVIPMSSQFEKYQSIIAKDTERYGRCLKIVVAKYYNKQTAFLIQNMFPILPKYFHHIHTINGVQKAVSHVVQIEILRCFKEARLFQSKGAKIIFPDINRLEKIMLDELAKDKLLTAPDPASDVLYDKLPFADRIADAKMRAAVLNAGMEKHQPGKDSHER